jgi:hypothetical protein
MLLSQEPTEPGFEGVVQHAHRPSEFLAYKWEENTPGTPVAIESPDTSVQSGFDVALIHVALDAPVAVPFAFSPIGDAENPIDSRLLARMALFPSGELPREVQKGQLGGDVRTNAGVPSAVVDEALFFPVTFGVVAGTMPGQLVLAQELAENAKTFSTLTDVLRTTLGDLAFKTSVLSGLPEHGGLLRMGDELLCYDSYDASTFVFTIPPDGRGLLGTEPQPHRVGEGIAFIGSLPLGILAANMGADDALVPLLDIPAGFPSHGLVRIDDELVHYTRYQSGVLEMPRSSSEPGAMDRKGAGLFRGRFGTPRADHSVGAPVILFPFRYWDRWSDLADAPELAYYQLTCDQPDAYWKRVFWKVGDAGQPGPQLCVLQRTDPATPWDAPPMSGHGLTLLLDGKIDGDGNPIGVQTDRVEWRVFVRHQPGSFDALQGLAHGWKTSPRLELFGVEYMGPSRTLARVDR